MKNIKENVEGLKKIGFKEVNSKKLIYEDIVAYMPLEGEYISFKYDGKRLPIIDKVKSIEMLIKGIYEYKFSK
jgi:hypothetical protein